MYVALLLEIFEWALICFNCLRAFSHQNTMLSACHTHPIQLVSTKLEFWTCYFQENVIFLFIAQWLWKFRVFITMRWKNVMKSLMDLVWLQNQFVCHCFNDKVSTSKVIKNNWWYNYNLLLPFLIISTYYLET